MISWNKSYTDYKKAYRIECLKPSGTADLLPQNRGHGTFSSRARAFPLCSSHGGRLAVTDAAQNPNLNALQLKFQRLFKQDKWSHVTDLTSSKCAVSARQRSVQRSRNCPGRGSVDGNFGSRRRLLVPTFVTNCVGLLRTGLPRKSNASVRASKLILTSPAPSNLKSNLIKVTIFEINNNNNYETSFLILP